MATPGNDRSLSLDHQNNSCGLCTECSQAISYLELSTSLCRENTRNVRPELLDLLRLHRTFGGNAAQNRIQESTVAIDSRPVNFGDGLFHRMLGFRGNQFNP